MAESIVNYSTSAINLSLNQYDFLVESIGKIDALVQVALLAELEELAGSDVLHYYLWVLRDLVEGVSHLCDKLEPKATHPVAN